MPPIPMAYNESFSRTKEWFEGQLHKGEMLQYVTGFYSRVEWLHHLLVHHWVDNQQTNCPELETGGTRLQLPTGYHDLSATSDNWYHTIFSVDAMRERAMGDESPTDLQCST